jgi:hypothetical protein
MVIIAIVSVMTMTANKMIPPYIRGEIFTLTFTGCGSDGKGTITEDSVCTGKV